MLILPVTNLNACVRLLEAPEADRRAAARAILAPLVRARMPELINRTSFVTNAIQAERTLDEWLRGFRGHPLLKPAHQVERRRSEFDVAQAFGPLKSIVTELADVFIDLNQANARRKRDESPLSALFRWQRDRVEPDVKPPTAKSLRGAAVNALIMFREAKPLPARVRAVSQVLETYYQSLDRLAVARSELFGVDESKDRPSTLDEGLVLEALRLELNANPSACFPSLEAVYQARAKDLNERLLSARRAIRDHISAAVDTRASLSELVTLAGGSRK